ncbi:MAG TPA: hypothetical protein VHM30_17465, partial [Gemmatimonadaceae bacterium]|nr:hypothetical protein [Gemmatimonadaceae bacterium]
MPHRAALFSIALALVAAACGSRPTVLPRPEARHAADSAPPPPPARWLPLIGEYGGDSSVHILLENSGGLYLHTTAGEWPLL